MKIIILVFFAINLPGTNWGKYSFLYAIYDRKIFKQYYFNIGIALLFSILHLCVNIGYTLPLIDSDGVMP